MKKIHRMFSIATAAMLVAAMSASCANSSGGVGSAGGDPVEAGATKAEYQDAFADMDTIEVQMQTLSAKGSVGAQPYEDYAAALKDWSGGKFDVEIAYSSSIVAQDEVAEALADGRIDFARNAPLYEPDEFPATNALVDLTFEGEHDILRGRLQRVGSYIEASRGDEEIMNEFLDHGLVPAFPVWPVTPMVVLACNGDSATSMDDMDGLRARASGRIHVKQLEALGITPADLTLAETYEGLQRGVIDCAEMSLAGLDLAGALEVAGGLSIGSETGFADTPGAYAFGRGFWEELPLPAQQLMWDRLDTFVPTAIRGQIEQELEALKTMSDNGGSIEIWDTEVQDKLVAFNEGALEDAKDDRPELVSSLEGSLESWGTFVQDDLKVKEAGGLTEMPEWYTPEDLKLEEFMNRFTDEILVPGRPD